MPSPASARHQVLDRRDLGAAALPACCTGACRSTLVRARRGCPPAAAESTRRKTIPVSGCAGRRVSHDLLARVQADAGGADHRFQGALLQHCLFLLSALPARSWRQRRNYSSGPTLPQRAGSLCTRRMARAAGGGGPAARAFPDQSACLRRKAGMSYLSIPLCCSASIVERAVLADHRPCITSEQVVRRRRSRRSACCRYRFCTTSCGLVLAYRRGLPETGRDHGHAQFVAHGLVVDRAEDHGGIVGGEAAYRCSSLPCVSRSFRPVLAGGDVDQHAARAGEVDALEQRAGHGLLGGDARAVDAARRRPNPSSPCPARPSPCARPGSRR